MRYLAVFIILSIFFYVPKISYAEGIIPLSILSKDEKRHDFQVLVAKDSISQARGLMFKKKISDDFGMLFDFGEEKEVKMWMKNTYISLDMLFINDLKEIVFIVKETEPLSLKIISAPKKVRYVLEIKGGISSRLGIDPGDKISF